MHIWTRSIAVICLIHLMIQCSLFPGIELDEDGALDGSSDLTIRGRLLYLVEKMTYLKKKQTEKPTDNHSKKPCK